MKTLTEFPGSNLKNAAKVKQELIAGGKSPEELPQALGEALKLEGDRLTFILAALELVGTKLSDLKRVIVSSLNEGEKAPSGVIQKENHTYLVEYYPPLGDKNAGKDRSRNGHPGDKPKGKRGKGGRRDSNSRDNNKRSDQRPQREPQKRPMVMANKVAGSSVGPSPVIRPLPVPKAKE